MFAVIRKVNTDKDMMTKQNKTVRILHIQRHAVAEQVDVLVGGGGNCRSRFEILFTTITNPPLKQKSLEVSLKHSSAARSWCRKQTNKGNQPS